MLKYGIEVEGGYARNIGFYQEKEKLQRTGRNVDISEGSDYSASLGHEFSASYYEEEVEFRSRCPIVDIEQHIQDWEDLMENIEFVSNPKNCGLHIHTSPNNTGWEDKKYQTFVYNLFFLLVPFAKFFKHRQQQNYCLGNGSFYKLVRFFTEEFLAENTKEGMIDRYKDLSNIDDDTKRFSPRSMIRLTTGKDTVEVRLFPSKIEFIKPLIKIIDFAYEQEEFLNASDLIMKNIVEILNLVGAGESIDDFKDYYNDWIK